MIRNMVQNNPQYVPRENLRHSNFYIAKDLTNEGTEKFCPY